MKEAGRPIPPPSAAPAEVEEAAEIGGFPRSARRREKPDPELASGFRQRWPAIRRIVTSPGARGHLDTTVTKWTNQISMRC